MAPFRPIAISAATAFTHPHNSVPTKCAPRCLPLTPPLPSFTSIGSSHVQPPTLTSIAKSTPTRLHTISLKSSVSPGSHNGQAILYMFLLATQFGLQPILTKRFTPKTINRSTVVFSQDVVKFFMAGTFLLLTGEWTNAVAGTCYNCYGFGIPLRSTIL